VTLIAYLSVPSIHLRAVQIGGHAEPANGRASARPGGFAYLTNFKRDDYNEGARELPPLVR
jgi:hypothetical protein